jgi:hypothetical protein
MQGRHQRYWPRWSSLNGLLLLLGLPFALMAGPSIFPDQVSRRAEALQSGPPWPWPAKASPVAGTATADLSGPGMPVSSWHFGMNTAWWCGERWSLDPARAALAQAAGIGFWRFPGGSSSDDYFWDGRYTRLRNAREEDNGRMYGRAALDTDGFVELCRKGGTGAVVTMNYGVARYGSLAQAQALALSWLARFQALGMPLTHVEIGNEGYGNWEPGSVELGMPRLTGKDYGRDFKILAAALKKAQPGIKVGAPMLPDDNADEYTGYFEWDRGVLTAAASDIDFLVYHDYFTLPLDAKHRYQKPVYSKLLDRLDSLAENKIKFDALGKAYGRPGGWPIACTEFGVINGSFPQSIEAVSMLFAAGALGEAMANGYASAAYWDWRNGYDKDRRGDFGLFSRGDARTQDDSLRPAYFAFAAWKHVAGQRLFPVQGLGKGLRCYATSFDSGEAGILVVNMTEKPLPLSVRLKNWHGTGQANAWCAQALKLDSRKVLWNGKSSSSAEGGPSPIGVEPYSLTLSAQTLTVQVPPVSVSAFLIH